MNTFTQRLAAGGMLALLVAGTTPREVLAQPPASGAPVTAQPGWYGYVPGQGWAAYAPPSAPAVAPGAATSPAPTPVAPGWAGYSPATGWTGYAPASTPNYSGPVVRAPESRILPPGASRRRAAHLAVNQIRPDLAYTLPAYREYGSGRRVPVPKPWLPGSP